MKNKLNPCYLKNLLNNNCDVKLYDDGLSEEGEPIVALFLKKQKCRFVEVSKIIIDNERKKVQSIGKILMQGDIAPNLKRINRGTSRSKRNNV